MSSAVLSWRSRALKRLASHAPLGIALTWGSGAAHAQAMLVEPQAPSVNAISEFFPPSVPGFDQERGLQLPTLGRAEDNGTGIWAGSFLIRPALTEGLAYDTNTRGVQGGPGSAYESTSAAVAANSELSRSRWGAYLGVANSTYFDTPHQDSTDWRAALGGGYTIGRGEASLAYSHLSLHEDPTSLGAAASSTPLPFQVDDVRADYSARLGRTALTPYLDFASFHYETATIGGLTSNQRSLDHDVLQAGVAVRYGEMDTRSWLLTVGAIHTSYTQPQPGVPAPDADSAVALAGFDWMITGPIALRVLVGLEAREFASRAYQNRTAPIGQAVVTWQPTRLTTVTGTVARSVEDAVEDDVVGTIYSRAEARVAHELRRNVILQGRVGVQVAQFLQLSGTQTDAYAGFGVIWQINRRVQLSADNVFDAVSGTPGAVLVGSSVGQTGSYTRDVLRVQFTFAL